ncbi:DUF2490 domain-containing protein [Hymenobacter aerophilus]|uniref:DUF2490 domain-containing protein n=1 Tax=Hymenobacter aerophilus TaxID=119644 RepID=UPI000362B2C0|nr:DUF2490 domain-containing protein [Hymenobacter aerophilus]
MNRLSLLSAKATTRTLLAGALLTGTAARAQTNAVPDRRWGSWLVGTVVLPAGPRGWGGYAEVQTRSDAMLRRFFYSELKAGVSYEVAKNFSALLGGGRYATSDYRDLKAGPLNTEGRLWQQLTLTQFTARLKLEHRYRFEQRWYHFRDDITPPGQRDYRTRMRYRFNAVLPLNQPSIGPRTLYLSAYDEVFFNPRGPFFERNRVYAGAGYQLDEHWTLQAGWVNQANYTAANNRNGTFTPQSTAAKNNLVLSVSYRLGRPATDPERQHIPHQLD